MPTQLMRGFALVDKYVEAIEVISRQITLPPLFAEAWTYVQTDGYYGNFTLEPKDIGVRCNTKVTSRVMQGKVPFGIVPIYREDVIEAPQLSPLECKGASAIYWQRKHAIVLQSTSSYPPAEKARILLHEAGHAWRALIDGRAGCPGRSANDPRDRRELLEERDLHWNEHLYCVALGGSHYQRALAVVQDKIARAFEEVSARPGDGFISIPNEGQDFLPDVYANMDAFLGPARMDSVRRNRITHLAIAANLLLIDQDSAIADKDRAGAITMQALYIQEGHEADSHGAFNNFSKD